VQQPTQQPNNFEQWYLTQVEQPFGGSLVQAEVMDETRPTRGKMEINGTNTLPEGQALYNLYGEQQSAGNAYQQALPQVNRQEDYLNQAAAINQQRLYKYLKMTSAARGQQISSGDMIQAMANYQNLLGNISATAEDQLATNQEQWYGMLYDTMGEKLQYMQVDPETGNYSFDDWNKLWKIYEQNKGKISEEQQAYLEFYLQNIDHGVETETTAIASQTLKDFVNKANTTMTFNGVEYTRQMSMNRLPTSAEDAANNFVDGDYFKDDKGREYVYYNKYLRRIKPVE